MKPDLTCFIGTLVLAVLHSGAPALLAESRTFTSTTGSTIQGELVSINLDVVTIKRVDGPLLTVKTSNFSAPDIAYLQAHGLKQAGEASPLAGATKERPFVK